MESYHESPQSDNLDEELAGEALPGDSGFATNYPRQTRTHDGHLKTVKNRLKVLRAERDWSQAELAGRLDVSRQAVNAIETGKHDPSLPLAFRIARLFDMTIEDIFDDGESA